MLNRRTLLIAASSVVSTAASAAPAALAPDPDAQLIEAWNDLVRVNRAFDHAFEVTLPDGGTDEDHEPFYRTIEACERRIEGFQTVTVAGLAVHPRYLFAKRMEFSLCATNWALYGEPIDEELSAKLNDDSRDKLLFNMAETATRAGGLSVGSRPESRRQFPEGGA